MTLQDSLIAYAVLKELGPDYDGFAEEVRLFELERTWYGFAGTPWMGTWNERGYRRRDLILTEQEVDAARLIAADFCEERGQAKVAEWLRRQPHYAKCKAHLIWIWSPRPLYRRQLQIYWTGGAASLGEIAIRYIHHNGHPYVSESVFEKWAKWGNTLYTPRPADGQQGAI